MLKGVFKVIMPNFLEIVFFDRRIRTEYVAINLNEVRMIEKYQPYQPGVKVTFWDGSTMIVQGEINDFI